MGVALGKPTGPPASAKQLQYLLALVKKDGHEGFRDARRSLGLTQRQGGGKFTTREASELIDRLLGKTDGPSDDTAEVPDLSSLRRDDPRIDLLRGFPADMLAAELERRGWSATPPP